jgi:hypothetical protein
MSVKTDISDQFHHVDRRIWASRQSDWLPHLYFFLVLQLLGLVLEPGVSGA